MALSATDRASIAALARTDVEVTTAGLKQFLRRSKWIGSTNRYVSQIVQKIRADVTNNSVNPRNLAQYIAASAPLHCTDAWSYLGRAIGAALAGDAHRAIHFAYYAELRATMSLLASEGIGIFDKRHFLINGPNTIRRFTSGDGTHAIAWSALEEWSRQPATGPLFARLITPEGISLEDWFAPLGGASTLAAQAQVWFMQWGMDLSLAAKDREVRNESSYRPDGVPAVWGLASNDLVDFLTDLWSLLEPGFGSTFDVLDREILRVAIEKQHHAVFGAVATPTDARFVSSVAKAVDSQNFPDSAAARLKSFLLRNASPQEPLVLRYSKLAPSDTATNVFAVMSRAVLLLRIATGSARDLLHQSAIDRTLLSFWWEAMGEARGLWRTGSAPSRLTDLWQDIADTLRDIGQERSGNPGAYDSYRDVAFATSADLNVLSSCERVGLWALCPT